MLKQLVVWYKDVDQDALSLVGNTGAQLGEMIQRGIPIADGFIVTSYAFYQFIKDNKLAEKITHLINATNFSNETSLKKTSQHIQNAILRGNFSETLVGAVFRAYTKLGSSLASPHVTIQSSMTAEDVSGTDILAHEMIYQNIYGEANILLTMKEAWASFFDTKAIEYRHKKLHHQVKFGVAVSVQKMFHSEISGHMLTINPKTNDKSNIVIEAVSEPDALLKQKNAPVDHYEVTKITHTITNKHIADQKTMHKKKVPKITPLQILDLATIAMKIEKHAYFPQEIQWVIEKNDIYITHIKPITIHPVQRKSLPQPLHERFVQTATKVFLYEKTYTEMPHYATLHVDGVLLDGTFLLQEINKHPQKIVITQLAEKIAAVCKPFSPRPVIYQATNLTTAEVFQLELAAVKLVRNKLGLKNIWLMLPFVRNVEELIEVKKILSSVGLHRTPTCKLWMRVAVPANVILLEKFIAAGIDGVSIDIDTLSMLLLGTDKDNQEFAQANNQQDPALLWACEKVIRTANKQGISSSLFGSSSFLSPNLLEKLIQYGITSVSVSSQAIDTTRQLISEFEKRLISK